MQKNFQILPNLEKNKTNEDSSISPFFTYSIRYEKLEY